MYVHLVNCVWLNLIISSVGLCLELCGRAGIRFSVQSFWVEIFLILLISFNAKCKLLPSGVIKHGREIPELAMCCRIIERLLGKFPAMELPEGISTNIPLISHDIDIKSHHLHPFRVTNMVITNPLC
jgi:hypothetical protein